MGVWLCWLWRGHFSVDFCNVAPLSFGGVVVGDWLDF